VCIKEIKVFREVVYESLMLRHMRANIGCLTGRMSFSNVDISSIKCKLPAKGNLRVVACPMQVIV